MPAVESTGKVRRWRLEDSTLRVPNQWSLIGRLFLAPFLAVGAGLIGIALTGIVMQISRGRFRDLAHELPITLGMLVAGALLAVPCWMGAFSWYDAVLDGKRRTIKVEEGAWPWIKRWTESATAFREVSIVEQELMTNTDGGGTSVSKQAVQLIRADAKTGPFVLERCDSYAEAQALAQAVSSLLRIPVEKRKR